MQTVWYDAEFIGQKVESPTTNRFWFKLLTENPIQYKSGQFLTFDFPVGDKRLDRWKSYSIANVYDGSNIIELGVSYKKGGLASQYLFESINKGDIIKCKGPDGNFVLPELKKQKLVLIATGAGVVPYRSMLQEIAASGNPYDEIHLIFGIRKEKDILYLEELEDWSHFIPFFKCSVCLSQASKIPKAKNKIQYHLGRVHQVYLEEYKTKNNNCQFMLCGWTNMIDEAVLNLHNVLKIPKEKIKYELFG
ncbi:MAG: FAD-dependent oxidoreductase [Saprospiraceae bacterium]